MARRYVRDNRGRFASAGAGATARGGRLRTASGNKRATQKIAVLSGDRMSAVPKGAIGKTRKQRQIQAIDRPLQARPAFNAAKVSQQQAIAARKAPKPALVKGTSARTPRGPMSAREQDSLRSAKGDLQTSKSTLKAARDRKAKASGPLEKLQAQSRIYEASLNVKRAERRVTSIQARPQLGAPITGQGRASERMVSAAPRRAGVIAGTVKRNPQAASMVKGGIDLNAGKRKNIYIANANKAAQARRKRK